MPAARLHRKQVPAPVDVATLRTRAQNMVKSAFAEPRSVSRIVADLGRTQQLAELEKVDIWFDHAVDRGKMKPDPYVYSSLVDAFSRNGDFARAEKLLEKQRTHNVLSVHSYTAILNSYLTRGYLARAESLVKQMKKSGITPTSVTYHSLLSNYAERGAIDKVETLLQEMEGEGHSPDEMTLGKLMTVFSKTNNHALVERLAAKLPSTTTTSGAVGAALWQARIHSALKLNDVNNALALTERARDQGASLSPSTYGHLVNGLARGNMVKELDRAVEWALTGYQPPPVVTFISAITAYTRDGQPDTALALLQRLKERGVALTSDVYNPLIFDMATRGVVGKLEALVQELYGSGLPFSEVTYRVLLKSFLLTHDYKRAKAVYGEIKQKGVPLHHSFSEATLRLLVDTEPRYHD